MKGCQPAREQARKHCNHGGEGKEKKGRQRAADAPDFDGGLPRELERGREFVRRADEMAQLAEGHGDVLGEERAEASGEQLSELRHRHESHTLTHRHGAPVHEGQRVLKGHAEKRELAARGRRGAGRPTMKVGGLGVEGGAVGLDLERDVAARRAPNQLGGRRARTASAEDQRLLRRGEEERGAEEDRRGVIDEEEREEEKMNQAREGRCT